MKDLSRRGFIGGAAAALAAGCASTRPALDAAASSAALDATRKWFKEAQFGMMAHWGLYTLLGGEWNGKPGVRAYGEWIQWGNRIPMKDYAALIRSQTSFTALLIQTRLAIKYR